MKPIIKLAFWAIVATTVAVPIVVYCIALSNKVFAESSGDFGTFGDYIGGTVGTIVGIISIYLLYKTYTSQVEFARSQDFAVRKQQFETTFFHLLEQQQMLREQLEGDIGNENYHGLSYLKRLKEDLADALSWLNYSIDEVTEENKIILKRQVNQLYMDFFLSNVSYLGHYFRHLYHILKYVDDNQVSDAKEYVDILQAQLSNDELFLLAINGISDYGRRKMLPLMDKYCVLENFNTHDDPLIEKLLPIFYINTKSNYNMLKSKKIIFIGGVHGVGKSTFIYDIKKKYSPVEGLSCSSILKWENPKCKEVEDVGETQNRLLVNLPYFLDIDKDYLLDGHFCLLTEKGTIERVPIDVFETIKPRMILLLEESSDVICKRLAERDSVHYSTDLIRTFIEAERKYAQETADTLGIPITYCNSENRESCISKIVKLLSEK